MKYLSAINSLSICLLLSYSGLGQHLSVRDIRLGSKRPTDVRMDSLGNALKVAGSYDDVFEHPELVYETATCKVVSFSITFLPGNSRVKTYDVKGSKLTDEVKEELSSMRTLGDRRARIMFGNIYLNCGRKDQQVDGTLIYSLK